MTQQPQPILSQEERILLDEIVKLLGTKRSDSMREVDIVEKFAIYPGDLDRLVRVHNSPLQRVVHDNYQATISLKSRATGVDRQDKGE